MKRPTKNVFWIGFIIGVGLLGSLDGIVFAQSHHTVFDSLVGMLFFWGGIKMYKEARTKTLSMNWTILSGAMLMGGGTFNMVEGILNHQILKVHHVKPGDPHEFFYDLLLILVGALLFMAGLLLTGILKDLAIDLKTRNREPEKS